MVPLVPDTSFKNFTGSDTLKAYVPLAPTSIGPNIGSNIGRGDWYPKSVHEPDPEYVFNVLVRKYIKGVVYGAFVESFTSEQNSRMTAMDNATANANDMLKKLDLLYNRARQSKITQDITEIVGGAESFEIKQKFYYLIILI